jgi:hypothetical protein
VINSTSASRVLAFLTAVAVVGCLSFAGVAAAKVTNAHQISKRKAAAKRGSKIGITTKPAGKLRPPSAHNRSSRPVGAGKKKPSSLRRRTEVPPVTTPSGIAPPTTTPSAEIPLVTAPAGEPIVAPSSTITSPPPSTVPIATPSASEGTEAPEETSSTEPAEDPILGGTPSCPLGPTSTAEPIPMTMPGCRVVASDTSALKSPTSSWGALQCMNSSEYSWGTTGGDPHEAANGVIQGNEDFRQMTTFDGDEFWGERCELGEDDWRHSPSAYYREGDHYVTYISEKLPSNFPLNAKTWQTVMQMKQAEPSNVGGGAPIIEMEARENRWVISDNWVELFSFPAKANTWTRFAWDVYYSKDPGKGWIQVSADLNGDGDFDDPGERSKVVHVATLKTEINEPGGTGEGLIAPGEAVPSHLRAGIYHNPEIPCPASTGGCSVQVDNVQVMAAP